MEQSAPAPTARMRGERRSDRQFPKIVPTGDGIAASRAWRFSSPSFKNPDSLARMFG